MFNPLGWIRTILTALGAAVAAFFAGRLVGASKAKKAAREADKRRADEINGVQVDDEEFRSLDDIALDALLREYRGKSD